MSTFKFAPFRIAHQLQNWPSKYHSGVSDQQILWETLRFKAIWTFGQPSRKGLQQLHESEAKLFSFYRNFFEPRLRLYLAPVYWLPVKMHSSHEDSGSVTSPTQQLQIAGIGSPKAPLPSAARHPPAADTLASGGGG